MKPTIIFIHDSLPCEGLSGQIIFLRHFQRLENANIIVIIPENAKKEHINHSCYTVETIPNRKKTWLPFREKNFLLRTIRIKQWAKEMDKVLRKLDIGKPTIILTVAWHYLAIASLQVAQKNKIPLAVFLHDQWELRTNTPKEKKVRFQHICNLLKFAKIIWPVSKQLAIHYNVENPEVLYPIPNGFSNHKPEWKYSFSESHQIIYAGTLEEHHLPIFELLIKVIIDGKRGDKFILISSSENRIRNFLTKKYPNIVIGVNTFSRNQDALDFIAKNASIILVPYGRTFIENPFSERSFPSKFIEYTHLHLPIITITPEDSAFGIWLRNYNWLLNVPVNQEDRLVQLLGGLSTKEFWVECAVQSYHVSLELFDPIKIQSKFEEDIRKALSDEQK